MPSSISAVPKQFYSASETAKLLGISLDTLRRWDRAGRLETARDSGNRRIISAAEVQRLRGERDGGQLSARNRIQGTVTDVRVEGLIAQVELAVDEPARLVAIVTADAVEDLGLKPGMSAAAVVKATSVMVEHQ
jgi:molybdopterin-binding protein